MNYRSAQSRSYSTTALVTITVAILSQTLAIFWATRSPLMTFLAFVTFAATEGTVLTLQLDRDVPDSPFEFISAILACTAFLALYWAWEESRSAMLMGGTVAFLSGQLILTQASHMPTFDHEDGWWPRALIGVLALGCYGLGCFFLSS